MQKRASLYKGQSFAQAHYKKDINVPHYLSFVRGNPSVTGGFPTHKGPVMRKALPCCDAIMIKNELLHRKLTILRVLPFSPIS